MPAKSFLALQLLLLRDSLISEAFMSRVLRAFFPHLLLRKDAANCAHEVDALLHARIFVVVTNGEHLDLFFLR